MRPIKQGFSVFKVQQDVHACCHVNGLPGCASKQALIGLFTVDIFGPFLAHFHFSFFISLFENETENQHENVNENEHFCCSFKPCSDT
jgi:hypothetical protein